MTIRRVEHAAQILQGTISTRRDCSIDDLRIAEHVCSTTFTALVSSPTIHKQRSDLRFCKASYILCPQHRLSDIVTRLLGRIGKVINGVTTSSIHIGCPSLYP